VALLLLSFIHNPKGLLLGDGKIAVREAFAAEFCAV